MQDSTPAEPKRRIAFLCTGNCIRSQMAEGLLLHLAPERFEPVSGGAFPAGYVHEHAIAVMAELGIDISSQSSKHIELLLAPPARPLDVLVSLCGHAAAHCPPLPSTIRHLHWPVDDPIEARGTLAKRLSQFRRVRDEILARLQQALQAGEL